MGAHHPARSHTVSVCFGVLRLLPTLDALCRAMCSQARACPRNCLSCVLHVCGSLQISVCYLNRDLYFRDTFDQRRPACGSTTGCGCLAPAASPSASCSSRMGMHKWFHISDSSALFGVCFLLLVHEFICLPGLHCRFAEHSGRYDFVAQVRKTPSTFAPALRLPLIYVTSVSFELVLVSTADAA